MGFINEIGVHIKETPECSLGFSAMRREGKIIVFKLGVGTFLGTEYAHTLILFFSASRIVVHKPHSLWHFIISAKWT